MRRPAVAEYPAGAGLAPRVIEDFEFVWMLRGHATFVISEERLLVPGQLLLVPPGLQHSFQWDHDQASRHGYVHFSQEDVRQSVAAEVRLVRMSGADPLAGMCAYLLWLGSSDRSDWEVTARSTLNFMLTLLQTGPLPSEEVTPAVAHAVQEAVSHLQREWSHLPLPRIGVAELASVAHISRGYLNRLFREAFGIGASAALEHLRCSRAEALLTRTNLTIAAIARQCGYADLAHFSHRFSSIHGMPPSRYRTLSTRSPSVLDQPGVLRLSRLVWD
ncbi:MAG TPA: helix-turn-helix domain-containing protein [Propionibacteriaceae bacterium]|nr:helix-turn-helix domain-containing protein [Propionibacteriaceae bacterium]